MSSGVEIKVSIAEVCEVRGAGLESPELLALAASAVDGLPPCPKGTVFDPENVFVSSKGNIVIKTTSSSSVEPPFVPPEWARGEQDDGAAAVYCLGAVMRACGAAEAEDVDLFSLVNILTVSMVGTRPTANRMGQMARNQLRGRDPRAILISLYEEIMGDEESNQLPDDMEYDDLSMDGDDHSASIPMTIVKKAVDFIEEEKDERGASTSSSSGNSTQKDSSPFDDDIEEEEEEEEAEHVMDRRVPAPIAPPRSPRPSMDDSLLGIGSPVGNSTRLNETYTEEHSVDMSFEKSFDSNFLATSSPIKPLSKTVDTRRNPFDDEIEEVQLHGGTLSGRDPFDDTPSPMAPKRAAKSEIDEFKDFVPKPILAHRFSSSSDEILEAEIDQDDHDMSDHTIPNNFGTTPKVESAFGWHSDAREKERIIAQPVSTSSSSVSQVASARRRSSTAELDRLKSKTDRLRADTDRLLADEKSELEMDDKVDARSHVDAVVITEQPPSRRSTDADNEDEEEEVETPIGLAFNEALRERRHSRPTVPFVADPVVSPIEVDSPRLERRNSLAPIRISGRQSTRSVRGKRKTRAVPEFYDNSRHPSIRLKAPSAKKKKMTLMRVEQSEVWVELLNGQRVEVSCRTDAIARDIFSLVVQHMNINEHVFFGLSFVRDGEHFFLEDHQRLEKFAPSGWKAGPRGPQRHQYVLYLRFRFYPQMLDFIKTEVTMHELYLQVRRDVIEERIQPKRDAAFELAALALQAEFGNRPPPVILDYFDNPHYLPKRFCSNDDPKRLHALLAERHSQYAGTKTIEAEHKFIQICQRHSDFSAHLHRVFRSKPSGSVGATPFDPDTGAALWIAIMPRGIAVYEEQGGLRERLSEHQWPDTQTLQFDKKKFVIVAVRDGMQTETVFYTDHHTKSSYFVKFAASQHRFMMKMRQWKTTLRHENTMQAMPDVGVEGRPPHHPVRAPSPSLLEEAPSMFARMPAPSSAPPPVPVQRAQVLDVSIASHDRSERNNNNETLTNSLVERFESATHSDADGSGEPAAMRFEVVLVKDPSAGLGLTLVDGNLNGVKGVYVKSVAENGAGMRAGLLVGDRLLAVDGTSLDGGDRHKAVELVKTSSLSVRMEIARLDGVVRHEKSVSRDSDVVKKSTLNGGLIPPSSKAGQSRTPPAPRRAANRRVRAVSDFGAIGDMLPALDSDHVIDIKAISGLHLDESDEERGEFRLPTASMYSFDHHDDDDPPSVHSNGKSPSVADTSSSSRDYVPGPTDGKRKYRYARKSNLDWTEELDEGEEEEHDIIYVSLDRNTVGSLGVQIASVAGKVCVKQLTAAPAAGHPDIRVGMQLVYVNDEEVTGKSHQEVVSLLRSGGSTVVLGLRREEKTENIITTTLEKQPHGSLGLSLAKRTGSDGIFIRMIADGSAASQEGSLRVGDRLLTLDGKSIENLTPSSILERLKAATGPIVLTVIRQ